MFVRKESIALLLAIATTARLQAATTTASQLVSDKSISAAPAKSGQAIPWSQISGKAGAGYKGDGLSVTSTQSGARLRCVIQRLEGEVTTAGLWLVSTVTNTAQKRFRVVASSIERTERTSRTDSPLPAADGAHGVTRPTEILPAPGRVSVDGQIVRFIRPGVIEEYSVSMDGVRQDLVVIEKPVAGGELEVRLDVTGARVEQTLSGAQLVLENSERRIAYSRLRVTDANGKELPA